MDTTQLQHPLVIVLLVALAIWSLVWKGFALWRAAEKKSKPWFIVLMILNTAGILEIIYLFAVAPRRKG
jgi:uncharacterized protein (DUF486 family)